MERPPISLDMFEQITPESFALIDELYAYYDQLQHNPRFAKVIYGILDTAFRSQVEFEPAPSNPSLEMRVAQSARDEIGEHFANGGQFIVVNNHQSMYVMGRRTSFDQFVLADVVSHYEELKPFVGNTSVWSKSTYFETFLRTFFESMHTFPIIRKRDLAKRGIEFTPEVAKLQEYSVDQVMNVSINDVNRGSNLALWPQGERVDDDKFTIDRLDRGIVRLLMGLDPGVNIKILGVLTDFEVTNRRLAAIRPNVVINRPLAIDRAHPDSIMPTILADMQHGLNSLKERH